jgi:hypothetical protein
MLYTLFKQLPEGVHPSGYSVALTDIRESQQSKDKDTELGITHVVGDLHQSKTWAELEKEMAGKKAKLVVSRSLGGVNQIIPDQTLHLILLRKIWRLTADGGVILLQLPHEYYQGKPFDTKAVEFLDALKEQGAEVRYANTESFSTVYIRKPINASNNLNFPGETE